ncbi:MAG: CsbD family protein [Actinomycetota bacterium]
MGTFEELKGKVKEKVGDLMGNDELEKEGEAQKEKGRAEHEADKARIEARAHDAKAKVKEAQQDWAEDAK